MKAQVSSYEPDKVFILNGTGLGSTSQKPLALIAKCQTLNEASWSPNKGGLASAAESDTMSPKIRYGMSIQPSLTFFFS